MVGVFFRFGFFSDRLETRVAVQYEEEFCAIPAHNYESLSAKHQAILPIVFEFYSVSFVWLQRLLFPKQYPTLIFKRLDLMLKSDSI